MIQVPGYILTKKLGVGGMATVYLALQTSLQRQVAMKIMAPAFAADRSFASRFVAEARTIAELNHPNIVAIHDVGVTDDGLHYFAMQYLPNGDLQSRIDAGIGERDLIRVLLGICSALEHAHERGFVHRDVTPGNVLFDNAGSPVLTDFGIARVVTEATRMTATGLSLGTSHYMSPEQARGRRVDFRSDLYSVGAVTYEALVGHPPYEGDDSFAVAYAHVYDPLPKLPGRIGRWQAFIDRAMAKDPEDRFQSAGEVRAALQQLLQQTSSQGRRTPGQSDSDTEPPTVPLEVPHRARHGRGRLRWLRLAFGRGPRDWLSGLAPALKWTGTWLADAIARSGARRWLAWGLAVFAVAFLAWALWPGTRPLPIGVDEPEPVAATEPLPTDPGPTAESPPGGEPSVDPIADAGPAAGDDAPAVVASFEPDDPALVDLENGQVVGGTAQVEDTMARQFRERILELVAGANRNLANEELTTPEGDNALEKFETVLSMDPNNIQARDGLGRIVLRYVSMGRARIRDGRYDLARVYQRRGTEVAQKHALMDSFGADLASIDSLGYEVAMEAARDAQAQGAAARAEQAYREALAFRPGDARAQAALDEVLNPVPEGPQILSDALRDGGTGPEMVALELAGRSLAVSTTEITLGLFRRFMAAAGDAEERRPACRHLESFWRSSRKRTWSNPGFAQTETHPVVCVTWRDADALARWLSEQTGQRYRLPSEAEWLALVDRGTASACQANLGDAALAREESGRDTFGCDDGFSFTAPVASFTGSAAGTFDVVGNVREWIADCKKQSRNGDCRERGVMGSAWLDGSGSGTELATLGGSFDEDRAYTTVGIRLIREL